MKLNPHHPARFWSHLGKAYFVGRQYGQAIEAFMHMANFDTLQHGFLAASYAWMVDKTAAAAHVGRMHELDGTLELERFLATMHFASDQDLQHLREGLHNAGL